MPTPTLQPYAGRSVRVNPMDEFHRRHGAFMGHTSGWERPMFYLPDLATSLDCPDYDWYGFYGHRKRTAKTEYETVHEEEFAPYTYSKRVSQAIREEVQHCRKKVALFDQTSFGKVSVSPLHYHSQFLGGFCGKTK